jgi:hypothetical protein
VTTTHPSFNNEDREDNLSDDDDDDDASWLLPSSSLKSTSKPTRWKIFLMLLHPDNFRDPQAPAANNKANEPEQLIVGVPDDLSNANIADVTNDDSESTSSPFSRSNLSMSP